MRFLKRFSVALALCGIIFSAGARAQTSVIPFEGTLHVGGMPASGSYDLRFVLYNAQAGGSQVGNHAEVQNATLTDGVFAVDLDFGVMPFTNVDPLWVEVAYRPAGSGASFTFSGVRDRVKASAYAVRAHHATTATYAQHADSVGGVYSPNIVQNNQTGVPQAGVTVNVSGDVSGFNVNAVNSYHIGFNRVLSSDYENLYVGMRSGEQSGPMFLGNSFFGTNSGTNNRFGSQNSFFGYNAGNRSTSSFNSFFGYHAGAYNTSGTSNSFYGAGAGNLNETGSENTFVGRVSGQYNSTGTANTFVGSNSGTANTTGNHNTFIGFNTGKNGTKQRENTVLGARADVGTGATNSTAIGNNAYAERPNSVVLGSTEGVNGAKASTNVGIGTPSPTRKLEVVDQSNTGIRVQTNASGGTVASFGGNGAFQVDAPGVQGGRLNITEGGNVGVGTAQPQARLDVNGSVRQTNGEFMVLNMSGIILKNAYGQCFRLQVNQSAQLVITGIFCP